MQIYIWSFSLNYSKYLGTNIDKEQVQIDISDCNCLESCHWTKETFEKNDAGFEWTIQKKGMAAMLNGKKS